MSFDSPVDTLYSAIAVQCVDAGSTVGATRGEILGGALEVGFKFGYRLGIVGCNTILSWYCSFPCMYPDDVNHPDIFSRRSV